GELTYTVRKDDLVISFTERGNVKAARSVPIYSQIEGQRTIVNLVPEGSSVKAGDVLVELDASDLTQSVNQQEIQVETAEAELKQAEEQLEIQRSLGESEVEKAALTLELAKLDLEKYSSAGGDQDLARQKAQADVEIAEKEMARAQTKFEWTDKLAKKGYVTGTELLADSLAKDKADLQWKQALGARALLVYTEKKDIAQFSSAKLEAEQALVRARRKAASELVQQDAAKKGKASTHSLSTRRLEKLKDQLSKSKILAPQDGMVVYPNVESWRRDRMITQGAQVHENQRLMDLPDISTMAVDVQVHESWVDQVHAGLPALVSIDALPNLNLKGRVTKVGLLPDSANRWLNADLKVYQTQIILDDSSEVKQLKPGMSARVQILVDVLQDVLFVPVQSVTSVDKQQVCYVRAGTEFVPRVVKGGKYNDSYIEIREGLSEGDIVQLSAPAPQGGKDLDDVEGKEAFMAGLEGMQEAEQDALSGPPQEKEGGRSGRGGARAGRGGPRTVGDGPSAEGQVPGFEGDGPRKERGSGRRRGEGAGPDRQARLSGDPSHEEAPAEGKRMPRRKREASEEGAPVPAVSQGTDSGAQ
ncbi:MAG TPA: efflux RND transporter periplasmic adaptor subunit, partial [Planctomycetota bacterium]|nr:efflux RND transporter periplasmic adaptor subunit [Planctomycetota bacterium]